MKDDKNKQDKNQITYEAYELIRIMLDENPHINILFDSSFKLIDCNPASVEFMGFGSKEEMIKGFFERIAKSIPAVQPDGRRSASMLEKLTTASKEGFVRFETAIDVTSGSRRLDVEFKKVPYGKDFLIVGFVYDLTSISERETELKHAQEKFELQLTKLNAVVNATKIGLWDVVIFENNPLHPDNIFNWSDEFRFMLGYTDENDFPNVSGSYFDKLHPDDKEYAYNAINNHLQDITGNTPYDVEYRLLCKNGVYKYFRACGKAIRDKSGNAIRVAGAVMDITESKTVLLDTMKQRMEAENASRAKSVFLSSMSHEIRTPLNAIIGMTTIGRMASDILKKDDAFNKIDGASKHLLGVINDILDMSKIEANKLELSSVTFVFKNMFQKSYDIINSRIAEKKIKFSMNIDKDMPDTLIGDDQRLTQVVTNLLSNAVKFTPVEGEITLNAQLVCENKENCRIKISVSDNGIGISENLKGRLFDSFEQADAGTSRNYGGTGLGLPISKSIVELMDGRIWVESEQGKGSVFNFEVLLKRGGNLENETYKINEKYISDNAEKLKGKNIILAEDVEINREIVVTLLEPMKMNIDIAENGKTAVEKYEAEPEKYDLIFMDIQMPVMDGYEAALEIRRFEKEKKLRRQVPVIAMTANVFREDVEKCLEAGMNSHIGKPIDYEEMINVLRQFI